jgi:hypothetical protein
VRGDDGFLNGPNVWVLIPLAALSIPIVAIVGETPLMWFLGGALLVVAFMLASRNLMALRHRHRLEELEARERIALAERDRLSAVDRMLEREGVHDPTRRLPPL